MAPHFHDDSFVSEKFEMIRFVGQPERHVSLQ